MTRPEPLNRIEETPMPELHPQPEADHTAPAPVGHRTVGTVTVDNPKIAARDVNVFYGEKHAIKHVDIDIGINEVIAFIGPSGCGKSTFLRCLNRMNDTIAGCRVEGEITLDNQSIYDRALDVVQLRARVGMVFQKPNPFPKSIYDNVAYGPKIHGMTNSRSELDDLVHAGVEGVDAGAAAGNFRDAVQRALQALAALALGDLVAQFARAFLDLALQLLLRFASRQRIEDVLGDVVEQDLVVFAVAHGRVVALHHDRAAHHAVLDQRHAQPVFAVRAQAVVAGDAELLPD